MLFCDSLLKCFFSNYLVNTISENDEICNVEIAATDFFPKDISSIESSYNFLSPRDYFKFTITFGLADSIKFESGISNYDDFLQQAKEEYEHQIGEDILCTITINKSKVQNTITIYDLKTFTKNLSEISLVNAFYIFDRVLNNSSQVIFQVFDLNKPFGTATLKFIPFDSNYLTEITLDRAKIIENLHSASYFTGIESFSLTPDDLKINQIDESNEDLCKLLNRYATVLSIIYLFDITSVHESEIKYKINGYKSIKGTLNTKEYSLEGTEEYYSIYQWVFASGNLNDKIGLARNIISLHFENASKIQLKGSPFQSIKSSYKVYEKQNIKQYVEIRNKISDQLLDFNNRANKVIETFASGFQKNALALISFYISAVAIKLLGKGEFLNIFTLDATILSMAFLSGSLIYFLVSRWEVKAQRKRFSDSYINLKERYTDLLDAIDIGRILNNDKEFNSDIRFIDTKLKAYSWMWLGIIIILLSITILLFFIYNISLLYSTPLWRFFFDTIPSTCSCRC